jgi:hypothetical protein
MEVAIRKQFGSLSGAITEPLYREFKSQMIGEIKRDALMREIRGEKWITINNDDIRYIDLPCLNCYAYKDTPDGGNGKFCLNHIDNNEGDVVFRRISYLQFLRYTAVVCPEAFFTNSRPGIINHTLQTDYFINNDKFYNLQQVCEEIPWLTSN